MLVVSRFVLRPAAPSLREFPDLLSLQIRHTGKLAITGPNPDCSRVFWIREVDFQVAVSYLYTIAVPEAKG